MSQDTIPALTSCSVCGGPRLEAFAHIENRIYRRCPRCQATLMDPHGWLSRAQERAVYRLHDNAVDDPGYRRFLSKLATPLLAQLEPGRQGLDFGCGPGPALAAMLEDQGHSVACYDPVFFPEDRVLGQQWDFITCTEVVEHLHQPLAVFCRLDSMLRPGGLLAIMTCFQTDDSRFAQWHYRRDPTHIVFYREATFRWLSGHFGWAMTVPRKDVVLLRKAG